ncbi:MAG TPA: TlpA disulfide reductase family protein [Flavisolibacter sp.]|nr:TlpA disulfide reductase family protein [Flavisolibacter sp.]
MKKFFAILVLLPVLAFAQNQQPNGFVINGKVAGLADGQVKIASAQEDHSIVASDSSKQGSFSLKGSIPEPGLYFLVLGDQPPQYIYLENATINVSGSTDDIKNLKIEGSKSHLDFMEFNRTFNPMIGELNGIAAGIQKEMNEKKRDLLIKRYDSVVLAVNKEVTNFISSKRSSYVSPFLLWVTAKLDDNPAIMEQRFNMLDENIRSTQIGKSLAEYIDYMKVGSVGTNAPDFTQNDVNGKPVSLSSFRGKYVLVDFWASWCRPCRAENPNVVKVYNKFKNKNFTILGVSLDDKKEAWVKAIQTDRLAWNHVSDLQQWKNSVAQQYHVQSIPGNFLIDPDGKIIAKDLRGEDLERKLCELFGCN